MKHSNQQIKEMIFPKESFSEITLQTLRKAIESHDTVLVYGLGEGTWTFEMISLWLEEVITARKNNHHLWIAEPTKELHFQLEILNLASEFLYPEIVEVNHVKCA